MDANREWAQNASVIVLTAVSENFDKNGKPNAAAEHDLGLAVANLVLEATARGLMVHQMIGINTEEVRTKFHVPKGFHPLTAIAVGYRLSEEEASGKFAERDSSPRQRKLLKEFVFGANWKAIPEWL